MSTIWDYPDPYLDCRAWGHHWETRGAFMESDGGVRIIRQRWNCTCGAQAVDLFHPVTTARIGHRQYTYPDGYSPAPDRADARKEWYRRHPPDGSGRQRIRKVQRA